MSRLTNAAIAISYLEKEVQECRALAAQNLEWALEYEAAGNIEMMEAFLDLACFNELVANDRDARLQSLKP